MTAEQKPPSLIKIESQQEWHSALLEIERSGLCGLILTTTGPGPLIHKILLVSLAEMEITGICFDSQKAEEMVREFHQIQ